MKEKYLPIGSVVTLKEATKKIMIIGYCPIENEKKQMYDYSACLYPEGVINSSRMLLCNHEQIAQIHFIGFENEEQIKNNEQLKSLVNQMSDLKEVKLPESNQLNNAQNIDTLTTN